MTDVEEGMRFPYSHFQNVEERLHVQGVIILLERMPIEHLEEAERMRIDSSTCLRAETDACAVPTHLSTLLEDDTEDIADRLVGILNASHFEEALLTLKADVSAIAISYKLLSAHTFGIRLNRDLKFVKDDSCVARLNTTFKCQRCAKCCEYEIFLSEQDILRLANFGPRCRSLVQYDETRKVYSTLRTESQGHTLETRCTFLDGKNCTVYAARPSICRAYPFFPIAKRDLDSLNITFPADAICVLDPNTKIQYLVFYDPECPGIGKGGLVNWNNVVQLSFEG